MTGIWLGDCEVHMQRSTWYRDTVSWKWSGVCEPDLVGFFIFLEDV